MLGLLYISLFWRLLVLSPIRILSNKFFPYPHSLISKPLFILRYLGSIGKLNTYVNVLLIINFMNMLSCKNDWSLICNLIFLDRGKFQFF